MSFFLRTDASGGSSSKVLGTREKAAFAWVQAK
jgi:hypothetical protein